MDLQISTTREQQAALDRSLADFGSQQTPEEFVLQEIAVRVFNFHEDKWHEVDRGRIASRVRAVSDKLTDEDKTALEALIAKHEAAVDVPAEPTP